jgi:hypothetical protein
MPAAAGCLAWHGSSSSAVSGCCWLLLLAAWSATHGGPEQATGGDLVLVALRRLGCQTDAHRATTRPLAMKAKREASILAQFLMHTETSYHHFTQDEIRGFRREL